LLDREVRETPVGDPKSNSWFGRSYPSRVIIMNAKIFLVADSL